MQENRFQFQPQTRFGEELLSLLLPLLWVPADEGFAVMKSLLISIRGARRRLR